MHRLFFLLPSVELTETIVKELEDFGVPHKHLHAVASIDQSLEELPEANIWQRTELAHGMEWGTGIGGTAGLLGGLMTLIGTPPNLLISESLTRYGLEAFKLFDFTPLGGAVMAIGVIFVALFGRLLLPKQVAEHGRQVSQRSLRTQYKLHERTFMMRVPTNSILVGKTLAESRVGSSTGLIILALVRQGRSEPLPTRQTVLRGGDGILVQGRVDQFRELRRWSDLIIEREAPVLKSMVAAKVSYAEVTIADTSPFVGELVRHAAFRSRFDVWVVGLRRRNQYRLTNLAYVPLRKGERVLVQGEHDSIAQLEKFSDFAEVDILEGERLQEQYQTDDRMFVVRLPKESDLVGATLQKSRLADVFVAQNRRVLAMEFPGIEERHPVDVGNQLVQRVFGENLDAGMRRRRG